MKYKVFVYKNKYLSILRNLFLNILKFYFKSSYTFYYQKEEARLKTDTWSRVKARRTFRVGIIWVIIEHYKLCFFSSIQWKCFTCYQQINSLVQINRINDQKLFTIIRLQTITDKMKRWFTIQSLIVKKSNEKKKKDGHARSIKTFVNYHAFTICKRPQNSVFTEINHVITMAFVKHLVGFVSDSFTQDNTMQTHPFDFIFSYCDKVINWMETYLLLIKSKGKSHLLFP
jgi:hypothetical protein